MEKRYNELAARVDEVEKKFHALAAMYKDREGRLLAEREDVEQRLSAMHTVAVTLQDAYNKAIEVVNDLAMRVGELEANYDPTVIK